MVRELKETRPITFKNSDNETLASVVNFSIRSVMSQGANSLQRGFVQGRDFTQNVVDLDVAGRIASNSLFGDVVGPSGVSPSDSDFVEKAIAIIDRMPLYIFLDIAAAFPSLAHKSLFIVLHALRPPRWFLNFVKFVYTDNFAVNHMGQFKFWILVGILQGCGLSGSLFALAFDPFLSAIDESVDLRNFGHTRACADDAGSALKALGHLKRIAILFGWASECASLCLDLFKTILIPLGAPCNASIIKAIRSWLELDLPNWSQVKIQAKAKYLGFFLAPMRAIVRGMPHFANSRIVSHRSLFLRRALPFVFIVIIRFRFLCCLTYASFFRRRLECWNSSCTLSIRYFIWPTLLSGRKCSICPRLVARQFAP